MKAIRQYEFGGPDVLRFEDAPRPEPAPGEVLVRVHAIGLNPPDLYLREGYKALPPEWRPPVGFPLILGTDISGTVEALGPDVDGFAVGDEVYAMVRFPSGLAGGSQAYAEYVSVQVSELGRKPAGVSHSHAAAAPMSLLTAWQFLIDLGHDETNPLQPHQHQPIPLRGKRVLINGAAGGVGHFAVQLAKWQGAHVIAVASGRHDQMLRDLGADEVLNYQKVNAEEVVSDIDLVVDTVGGVSTGRFLQVLAPGGALFPIFPLGFDGAEEAGRQGFNISTTQVRSSGAQLDEFARLIDDGTVRAVIDSSYPLSAASEAHRRGESGHLQGKVVLTID